MDGAQWKKETDGSCGPGSAQHRLVHCVETSVSPSLRLRVHTQDDIFPLKKLPAYWVCEVLLGEWIYGIDML